jgi:hypothetical protein
MTKEEMEQLADLVVYKLINKQKDLDKEFIDDLKASNIPIEVHEKPSIKDRMINEIVELNILRQKFEEQEKYEDCAKCAERIYYLKGEISKMK